MVSCRHLLITGKVQGVFYRAMAKEQADTLGISGWVKNTSSGEVEALICGEATTLQEFINWCRQGPPNALVSEVLITEKEPVSFNDFSIIR